jgi:hypothetical protein
MHLETLPCNPFENVSQLKQLVFMHARPDHSPSPIWHNACKSHRVKFINVSHLELPFLMVSQIIYSLSLVSLNIYQEGQESKLTYHHDLGEDRNYDG